MDVNALPEEDRAKLMQAVDEVQTTVSMQTMYFMVEKCFGTCVESFRRKTLEKGEEKCVQKCIEKFTHFTRRLGVRFEEINAQQEQEQLQALAEMQAAQAAAQK